MANLLNTAGKLLTDLGLYWKTPPKGRYMAFREIAAYAGGGIGVQCIINVVTQMILSTNNTLIGNTIGIEPGHMYIMYIIGILASIPLAGLRANIIDNTRGREGKYRPYLLKMGVPCIFLAAAFVWMPYEKMESYLLKCVIIVAFNICFQFFFNFFNDSYENLIHVLSPNSQERTDVAAIRTIIYSLAPSIISIGMPLFAQLLVGGSMVDIRLYRWVYPPILAIGFLGTLLVYSKTKEKIVQAKTHVAQVRFIDSFRAVAKNKYFWIISMAGWLGFLEGAQASIMLWLYQYGKACNAGQYSLITAICGNASLWGMLMAPAMIRKFGKKRVLVVTNIFNILFIALMIPFIDDIWMIALLVFFNSVVGAFMHVLNPAIQADIRDYQHYVAGERIDGMFVAVGVIGSIIGLFTSGVVPAVQTALGVTTENAIAMGYSTAWDVLYNQAVYDKLITVLILMSVIGAFLNVLPYFFYDLTEIRQKAIIKVLKIRAMFEDFGNDVLDDKDIVESLDIIHAAEKMVSKEPVPVSKAGIKAAKKEPNTPDKKAKIKAAKKELRDAKQYNEDIEISQFVLQELHKFETQEMQAKVTIAKELRGNGLSGLSTVPAELLINAKQLPKTTKEEKMCRKEELEAARARIRSKKLIEKHFNGTLTKYDRTNLNELYDQLNEAETALEAAYEKSRRARRTKNKADISAAKAQVNEIRGMITTINGNLKKENKIFSLYHTAAKPYLDAKRLMIEEENYKHYEEIAAKYEEAKINAAEKERLEKERIAREEAEKKAFEEQLKAERKKEKEKEKLKEKDKVKKDKTKDKDKVSKEKDKTKDKDKAKKEKTKTKK